MTFKRWGQGILAAAVSAGIGLGLLSCAESNTIDYLYLLSSKNNPGQINVYDVDSQTGALTQIPDSPYSTLGRDPVGVVTAPNGKYLYVIDQIDNVVQPYGIGTDAKLYAVGQGQINTPGSEPVALGINPAGTLLFVVDIYQPGYSTENPGAGAIIVYPINANGTLGTAVTQTLPGGGSAVASYYPIGNAPTAISVLSNGNTIYVTDQLTADANGCSNGQGGVLGLSVNSTGSLTPVNGSPFCAGTAPSAIASNAAASFVYITDGAQNQVLGYTVNADGSLSAISGGTVGAGSDPDALTLDGTGAYLYVANRNSNTIESYTLNQSTGIPAATGTYATQTYPQCIIVEPNYNRFVYTADFLGAGSTGYQIDPGTGMLTGTEHSPFGGTGQATCLAATVHNKRS